MENLYKRFGLPDKNLYRGPQFASKAFLELLKLLGIKSALSTASALKSGPVSVLLPFLEGPRTGPVPESFRMQEPRTGTVKNRSKLVVTGLGMNTLKHVLYQ